MGNDLNHSHVTIRRADTSELETFKTDLQETFRISAEEAFGHAFDEPVPSDVDIEASVNATGAIVYHVLLHESIVGGAVVSIDEATQHNRLLLFFILPSCQDRGVGYEAWRAIEEEHKDTTVWQTVTPCFEKRNIHFYVNKCGFRIVACVSTPHADPNCTTNDDVDDDMFTLEKHMYYTD